MTGVAGMAPHGAPLAFLQSTFTQFTDECIYWPFSRHKDGRAQIKYEGRSQKAHRIACERFNGRPPTSQHETAHSCANGHLGCVNGHHLRWATRKENAEDMVRHGHSHKGERSPVAKLTELEAISIFNMFGTTSNRKIARKFNVSPGTIDDIMCRRTWKHIHLKDLNPCQD